MYDNWKYSQLRRQELLRQAQQNRLAREAMGRRQSIVIILLARLGGLMVATGEMLHRRYAPTRPAATTFVSQPMPIVKPTIAGWHVSDTRCERSPSEWVDGNRGLKPLVWKRRTSAARRHSASRRKSNG